MTDVPATVPQQAQEQQKRPSVRELVAATEIDLRLFGMLVALLGVILLGFDILTSGKLLQTRPTWSRCRPGLGRRDHRDRAWSWSSCRATSTCRSAPSSGVIAHDLRAADDRLPAQLRSASDIPFMWILALALGIGLGAAIGGVPGLHHRLHRRAVLHRHARRAAGLPRPRLVQSQRRPPWPASTRLPAPRRRRPGLGRRARSPGSSASSAAPRSSACSCYSRRQRRRFGFPVRPMWAEVLLGACRLLAVARAASGSPTTTSGRRASPTAYAAERTASPAPAGWPADPGRLPVADRPRSSASRWS